MISSWTSLAFFLLVYQAASSGISPPRETLHRPVTCNRLQLPAQHTAGQRALFNPAAVRHPQLGWFLLFRYDPCHTGLSKDCKATFTWPFISSLGEGPLPDLAKAAGSLAALRYTEQTVRSVRAQLHTNDTLLGDIRCAAHGMQLAYWPPRADSRRSPVRGT
jgi:hypothetical protein